MPLFFLCLSETEAISAASAADLAVIGVTATLFTILGNVCKVLSIVINVMIWDKHATPFGILCLLFCLVAAYFYQQAPLRHESSVLKCDALA